MPDVRGANDVQVRGRRNVTPPALNDGDTSELQLDAVGNLLVNLNALTATLTNFLKGTSDGETLNAVIRRVNAEPALITHDKSVRDILDEFLLTFKLALEAGGIDFDSLGKDGQFQPGASTYRVIALASTNADLVSTGYSNLRGYYIFNTSASTKYVKLYNLNRAPTVGTDKPALVLPIPAGGAANVLDGLGALFSQGIGIALTGGSADSDTTALTAGDLVVNLYYAGNKDSEGFNSYRVISAATTNADIISTYQCNLNGYYFFNTSASTKYVKLYNLNRAPVVGTDKPFETYPIAAGGGANVMNAEGVLFSQGMAIAITGAAADTDATAVAASDIIANVFYS